MGWKELLGHSRAWAVVIGMLFQVLAAAGVLLAGNEHAGYIMEHAPYLLAGMWAALVLGKGYEDARSQGDTSALVAWRAPGPQGGWWYALRRLVADEGFVATLVGTVLAMVALCAPLWPGMGVFQSVFVAVAYAISVLAAMLTGGLKFSAAHAGGALSMLPPPPPAAPDPPASPAADQDPPADPPA